MNASAPAFAPIAIVGRACVLPGALTPSGFTEAILAGRDLLSTTPPGRWRLDPDLGLCPPDSPDPDRAWSDRGGYATGFERAFDAAGFALPAEQVVALDPLFQWLLHCGREALADAGIGPGELRGRGGAVVGNLSFPSTRLSEWAEAIWRGLPDRPAPLNRFMSGLPAHLLASGLGLGGSAFALDAACASSLYAIKLACDRLHDRRADVMLAGAVSRADDLFIHVGFCALRALSRTGRSRPFHAEADGLVPAEGAALFVLRRLEDAVAAGQRVYGVIRGIGLSNDGRGSGLLAPAEEGQERAMRAAYAAAGVDPRVVGLLECHATGTPVGDATELRSSARVFAGHSRLAIGSVKSNLGHLITTAGSAALLKVLGAFAAGMRPRTLHVERPTDALRGTPFQLLAEATPWPEADAPRLAAISAFGFGGNNGHLLVEEWRPAASPAAARNEPLPTPPEPVAIVAVGACVGGGESSAVFVREWLGGLSRVRVVADLGEAAAAEELILDGAGLRFPPRDLQHALPQQLLVLQAVREAIEAGPKLPRERTSVLVGMQCDAEVARNGARWRAAQWAREQDADAAWQAATQAAFGPPLDSAGVVGTMPNIVANRLTSQFDLAGPSFAVSAEELSGLRALEVAVRALRAGEIDAAVVAAVDLCAEPVHATAAAEVLPLGRHLPGDAAVALIVKRLSDAERDGDVVLARVADQGLEGSAPAPEPGLWLTPRFGHAHAASGLLHLLAAAAAVAHGARAPREIGLDAQPWLGAVRCASVHVQALGSQSATIAVANAAPRRAVATRPLPRLHLFSGGNPRDLRRALDTGHVGGDGPCRLALVATPEELPSRIEAARRFLDQRAQAPDQPPPQGVAFRDQPVDGELAYVFTGPAGSYPAMGSALLLALPELQERLEARFPSVGEAAGWVYDGSVPRDADKLWGSAMLCQAHAELTLRLLDLHPQAAIGFCAGETNALYALGAWNDIEALRREIAETGVYDVELAGEFRALQRAWGTAAGERPRFESWRVLAPLDRVRESVAGEERVHLSIVNAPGDAVISGDPEACRRAIARLGPERARPLGYDMVIHVPELAAFEAGWRGLHTRATAPVPGIRFYSQAFMAAYTPDRQRAADALTGQALRTVDFPALIERAYADGVRVFLEHGPQGGCARWISRTLGERDHVAASLDISGVSPLEQALVAVGWTWCAGLAPDIERLHERLTHAERALAPRERQRALPLRFAAHPPRPILPPVPARHATKRLDSMMPAPALPPALAEWGLNPAARRVAPPPDVTASRSPAGSRPAPVASPRAPAAVQSPITPPQAAVAVTPARVAVAVPPASVAAEFAPPPAASGASGAAAALAAEYARVAGIHAQYLRLQAETHAAFLAARATPPIGSGPFRPAATPGQPSGSGVGVNPAPVPWGLRRTAPPPPSPQSPAAIAAGGFLPPSAPPPPVVRPTLGIEPAPPAPQAVPLAAPRADASAGPGLAARRAFPGPAFSRAQLETLASGRISSVFGASFERQDGYERQVRMPEPPLLLADRVLGIEGEPGAMGTGTIWTETDVAAGAFYLHENRMPAGILIESGQADLLLISWLGVDFLNQGERVYRLLGCDLTYHGHLPEAGETLRYAISVDGHAAQGAVRLFFFHYDCEVAGRRQISVRGGQAGFFTYEELADSGGVLWDPATEPPKAGPRLDPPTVEQVARHLSRAQLEAFAAGRADQAFGDGFLRAATHVQPPRIAGGDMLLLHEVEALEPAGGVGGGSPWQRGYLRARWDFTPDDWFFDGHFKNDPCMPGTLMFEGCLQAMAVYVAAHGYTIARDGWRFEPVPEVAYKLRCRGQATPISRTLVYELFVEELVAGPEPTLWADLLCTVDGLKAFHCRRMGLRLVPDVPLSRRTELVRALPTEPAASGLGITFDDKAVLACAWGRSSEAFGTLYPSFDGPDRLPRLPGPPFFFMSRITKVDGELGNRRAGTTIECTWDVDPGAWFFAASGADTAPFCVLLEAMLQPCGWLALASGSALAGGSDGRGLHFRNLDGSGRLLRELRPGDGPLVTRITLKDVSASGGMTLVTFDVDGRVGGQPFFTIQTGFGFFPAAALAHQVGTGGSAEELSWAQRPSDATLDLAALRARQPRTAGAELFMFDRITGFWPTAGAAGLGRIRGEKDVRAEEWFFKAHFFQDPVMPGSLGLEALLQLLQAYMLATDLAAHGERFGPLGLGDELIWKYRGQVIPERHRVLLELEITAAGRDGQGGFARADGWLSVDGIRIYAAKNLSMRCGL